MSLSAFRVATSLRAAPRRAARRARLLVAAVAAAALLAGLALLQRGKPASWAPPPLQAAAAGVGGAAVGANCSAAVDWEHPLFERVAEDLQPFQSGGISLQLVEQAYCAGSRGSMRVQMINGSVYVAGESPSYESRMLGLKRQLLQLWLACGLPEGLDFVLEQEDLPTARRAGDDCPVRGPLLAPAKQPANASHAHVLLAPDHSFAGWLESHTLSWAEMLPLLQHSARRHPWAERSGQLFFRGAATGRRNLTDPDLSAAHPGQLDVQLVNWTSAEEWPRFVSLADHCAHKLLLHLPGNSYAGRLKYLLACASTVVMPTAGGKKSSWAEFFYHLLRSGENVVVVEEVSKGNQGHHLADVAAELQQDDALARRLGEAGAALVADALRPSMVQAYWQRLLGEYRRLQAFNATLHPDAIPLERSILMPQVRNVTQRTCSVCAPTREQLLEQRRADLGLAADAPLPELEALPLWQQPLAALVGGGGGAAGELQ